MPLAQPQDRRQHALTARETGLGIHAKARPGVRPGPLPHDRATERTHRIDVMLECTRPRPRETPVRTPGAHERHGEVPSGVRSHERNRMMPLAQPDANAVSKLALERRTARTVEADRADRHLHRQAAGLVERGQTSHAASLPRRGRTRLCRPGAGLCRSPKWHSPPVSFDARPQPAQSPETRTPRALRPPTPLIFRSSRSRKSAS